MSFDTSDTGCEDFNNGISAKWDYCIPRWQDETMRFPSSFEILKIEIDGSSETILIIYP